MYCDVCRLDWHVGQNCNQFQCPNMAHQGGQGGLQQFRQMGRTNLTGFFGPELVLERKSIPRDLVALCHRHGGPRYEKGSCQDWTKYMLTRFKGFNGKEKLGATFKSISVVFKLRFRKALQEHTAVYVRLNDGIELVIDGTWKQFDRQDVLADDAIFVGTLNEWLDLLSRANGEIDVKWGIIGGGYNASGEPMHKLEQDINYYGAFEWQRTELAESRGDLSESSEYSMIED